MTRDAETDRFAVDYEPAVRAYLTQLIGPDRARRVALRVLAELSVLTDDADTAAFDVAAVHRVARSAGLDALDGELHTMRRRIVRTFLGRRQCSAVAHRLRDREQGRISPSELVTFYEHLERCQACAGIVGRFQTSDWELQAKLGSMQPRVAIDRLSTGADASAAPAPPAFAEDRLPEVSRLPPSPRRPPDSTAEQQSRRPRRLAFAVVVVAVALSAGVYLTRGPSRPSAPPVSPGEQATSGNAAPPTRVLSEALRTPFVLAGARFTVIANAHQAWTAFARRVSAGPGHRWELVTVGVSNLARSDFDPLVLHYRLLAAGGSTYYPALTYGTGPALHLPPKPLAKAALVQAELAFQVPNSATGLQLAFDPTGRHERVAVTLGG